MSNLYSDLAISTLASSITNVATSLTVASGQGALFPVLASPDYFYATLTNSAESAYEIVKVTARTVDTFTVVRAQGGTTAVAWNAGDKCELRVVAQGLNNLSQLDSPQTYAASKRGMVTTNNTLSFDMNVTNNLICTPTAGGTLAFTNITAGQSGNIIFVNNAAYAIAKSSYIKAGSNFLGTISQTGTYFITYYSPDGTNVYITTSGALS